MASPPNKSSVRNLLDILSGGLSNQAPQGSNSPPAYPTGAGNAGNANQQSNTAAQQQSQAAAGATPMVWGFGAEVVAPPTAVNRIWALCTCVLNHNTPVCVCCGKPMRAQADSALHFGMADAPELDHWHLACLLDQLMKPPQILVEPVSPVALATVTVVKAAVASAMADMCRCGACGFTARASDFRHYAKLVGLP